MNLEHGRIPPGPAEKYHTSEDLLRWMSDQFDRFGSIYRASIYGTNVYVVSDPEHVDHVLRINWRNYKKGQAIKRIGFLLGNGLIVSEGEFWKSQRRMIQPAFHDKAIGALINVIYRPRSDLLFSGEYRHLRTFETFGSTPTAEQVNMTMGVLF